MIKKSILRPVIKQSAEALVTDSLRNYVLSGALKPGSRLTEVALADHMGVARATLRTGLHKLASEGIVVQIPYIGWEVAELTPNDVWELWTLRGSLEGLAAKLAAERMTPILRNKIQDAVANLTLACSEGDMEKASECDFALHRTIIDSVGHSRLMSQYRLVEQQVRLYISTSNALAADDLTAIVAQHQPLVDALLSGDAARAAAEAWRHNESEGEKLAIWLQEHNHNDGSPR